jgi:hypothetical protein
MTHVNIDIPPADENPCDADVHFLEDQINQYNVDTTKIDDGRIMSFLLRDEHADIIAGLYGWTWGPVKSVTCGFVKTFANAAMVRVSWKPRSERLLHADASRSCLTPTASKRLSFTNGLAFRSSAATLIIHTGIGSTTYTRS